MSKATVLLPELHPGQLKVLSEARRFNLLRAGRRFGKSTLGRHLLMSEALKGRPAAWIAPTYKYLTPNWREVSFLLQPVIESKWEEEKHIRLINGGEIDFWSADGGTPGEGRFYSLLVFDECAMLGAQLEALWTRSLRPTLADFQGGAWFLSTSKAASSYFNQMFAWGQGERDEWRSWQLGTADNPYISPEEIASARRDLPAAAFAQEFEGNAVSFSGSVFVNLEAAIIDRPLPPQYMRWEAPSSSWLDPGIQFYCGVDWAGAGRKAGGDWTAMVVLSGDGVVCNITRVKADYAAQRELLKALVERYHAIVLAERNSIGDPQIRALQASGLRVQSWVATNATKAKAVESLALKFEQGRVKIPDIETRSALLGELMAYEAVPLANGMTRFSAPSGGHDDLVTALMIANLAASRPRSGERGEWIL